MNGIGPLSAEVRKLDRSAFHKDWTEDTVGRQLSENQEKDPPPDAGSTRTLSFSLQNGEI